MHPPGLPASLDLASLSRLYRRGGLVPRDVVSRLRERIETYPDRSVWIDLLPPEEVRRQADEVAARRAAGRIFPYTACPSP